MVEVPARTVERTAVAEVAAGGHHQRTLMPLRVVAVGKDMPRKGGWKYKATI